MTFIPPPPPPAASLPYGTRLPAGLGHSTVIASMDFETYSEAGYDWDDERKRWVQPKGAAGNARGLGLVGTAVYAQHPTTDVLCFAYNLKDGRGVQRWRPGMPNPQDLFNHMAAGKLVAAWNVAFEWWIWTEVCVPRYGWPPLNPRILRCDMAKARAFGLPGKLSEAGRVLNVATQKDADGDRLLKKFSMPRNPTIKDQRRRIRPEEDPVDAERLYAYNAQDIDAEDEVAALCPDLEGEELEFWFSDQAINRRGVHIDRPSVEACAAIVDQALLQYDAELYALTGGAVEGASKIQALTTWLHTQGVHMDSLDEDAVTAQLERLGEGVQDGTIDPREIQVPYRALEIRQMVGSASVKKVYAMLLQCARGDRLHDLFTYHAARTGRPTGNGPQPTNLPKAGPDVLRCGWKDSKVQYARGCGRHHAASLTQCPWCGVIGPPDRKPAEWNFLAATDALLVITQRSLRLVEAMFGTAMLTVSGCLRALFTAAPGKQLIASDFTAIEAVVIAALAGEQWRLEVFRNKTDIYLESIGRSTGTPVAEMIEYKTTTGSHHPLRAKGKIQELALGFGGWIGALRNFGAEGTDEELKAQVLAWRAASPAIVELWGGQTRDFGRTTEYFGMEGASVLALLNPGQHQCVMRLDGSWTGLSYVFWNKVLYLSLPSNRCIAYQNAQLVNDGRFGTYRVVFEGWNTNPKKGRPGWIVMDLYGGLDGENATQAIARDIQRAAINRLERQGLPVVLHVYDEDVTEVEMHAKVEDVETIMATETEFSQGWPVRAAGGWAGERYRKD